MRWLYLALPFIAAAAPAAAQSDNYETRSVIVRYADLDLATGAGLSTLHARAKAAINEVCGNAVASDPMAMADWARCRAEATRSAHAALAKVIDERPLIASR